WDLLHEYGHSLLPIIKGNNDKIEREKKAWDFADIERQKYRALAKEQDNFYNYKKACLKTYTQL
ncbi:MAG TPA: hypothetical protein VJM83_03595, partial [Nitrospirota bacterium]|nr:hypothetical protein [Nitrospirota bacterium]